MKNALPRRNLAQPVGQLMGSIRPVNLSITHKFGSLAQDRFDFLCGNVERDVHGALARAFPRSVSMSLWSLR